MMATINREVSWNTHASSRVIRQRLPAIKKHGGVHVVIDYDKLSWLCNLHKEHHTGSELIAADDDDDKVSHDLFMQNYKDIFVSPPKKTGMPIHSQERSLLKASTASLASKSSNTTGQATGYSIHENGDHKVAAEPKKAVNDTGSHDIRDYLQFLHKNQRSDDPECHQKQRIQKLKILLKKMPLERTSAERKKIYMILKTFPKLTAQIPAKVLKELCMVAVLETWSEMDFTVFGSTGFHMIVRGTVTPLTYPYLNTPDNLGLFRSPTPIANSIEKLKLGDCFGTLEKVEGRAVNTRILCVKTQETNCEFLKIYTSDYRRAIEQIKHRDQTEKVNLLLSCGDYKLWPRQPLLKVANLIEYISYPPNTILVSEGFKSPYMAFIRSGQCHVLRQLDIMQQSPNGLKEKTKQVVMGMLGQCQSFAEISVLLDEPNTCSVVTATDVQLGIIKPGKLTQLDDVTKQLFIQSSERTFGNLTKDDIQDEYIRQQLQQEWNQYKHNLITTVINARGIRPGYGKWAK